MREKERKYFSKIGMYVPGKTSVIVEIPKRIENFVKNKYCSNLYGQIVKKPENRYCRDHNLGTGIFPEMKRNFPENKEHKIL